MYLIDSHTTENYLRQHNELASGETVVVRELAGGVSNVVLLVERGRGDRFVLKQAREQLRVQQEWKCDVRRLWREMEVLKIYEEILKEKRAQEDAACVPGISFTVPELLFHDRDNYCYAMTAAPPGNRTWKERLLSGEASSEIAVAAARLLGTLHGATWKQQSVAKQFGDCSFFEALRIDPYYRRIAEVHPELRPRLEGLIDSLAQNACCLVHGDFSPKNMLISPGELMLIDFEVGHYGDPAFDCGFFWSHLLLKGVKLNSAPLFALAHEAWQTYLGIVEQAVGNDNSSLATRGGANLAACLLARIDGKSPVDYLSFEQRATVRELAIQLLRSPPANMEFVFQSFRNLVP